MTTNSQNEISLDEVIQQLNAGTSMPAELMEIFSEEADDHLRTIYDGLNRLQNDSADTSALADVRRASHTLKGAAGAVGLQSATRLAHRMEDLLDQLAERSNPITETQLKLLLATADQLQGLTTGDFDVEAVAQQILALYQEYSQEMGVPKQPQTPKVTNSKPIALSAPSSFAPVTGDIQSAKQTKKNGSPLANEPTRYVRVPMNRLNDLVGLLGEMMVNRSEFQYHLDDFDSRIEDMQGAMERLRDVAHYAETNHSALSSTNSSTNQQVSSFERHRQNIIAMAPAQAGPSDPNSDFDVLEFEQYNEINLLTQTLSEAENDADIMADEFRRVKSAFDFLLRRQGQLNREAQQSLMRIRLVPLSGIVSRLERTVRTVSGKLGRNIDLNVVGERIELDKTVLDEITDPLLHLIRNAIDHGVEDAETRAAAGKPETAQLSVTAVNHGTQVALRISDDGAGINLEKVRAKAIQQGLIETDQTLTNDELHALIFRPGFSTADQLTDISGRGVGMDVVGEAIRRLKGTICVDSEPGVGTTFSIHLPTTLGVTRALLIESGGNSFAIPMESIEKIQNLDPATVSNDGEHAMTNLGDRSLRLIDLAVHLQLHPTKKANFGRVAPMLMLGKGPEKVAMTVDQILGSQFIVVKPLGDHLKKVRGFVGATIAGDGSVIPILDSTDLVNRNHTDLLTVSGDQIPTKIVRRDLAMVIDDSISVRRVTESLLTAAGWDVATAKDGVDALEKLAALETSPDVFLCDMEMPRMDGLELVRQIREQKEFEVVPIVMVTSRASEKHRNKAFDAGATDFVVKPFNAEQLLERITGLIQTVRETVAP